MSPRASTCRGARREPDRHGRLLRPRGEREPDRRGAAPVPGGPGDRDQGRPRRTGPGEWPRDARPERLKEGCEGSLRRLRSSASTCTSCTRPTRRCRSRSRSARSRSCRTRARSATSASRTSRSSELERARALVDVVTVQNRYNLADRHSEDVLEVCDRDGHRVHPLVPAGHRRSGPAGRPARRARPRP